MHYTFELQETLKEIRNATFDRFQFFRWTQNPGESSEQFHLRMKQKAALCNWENLGDSLLKSFFIQGMANPQIQTDLLSEDKVRLEKLNYALTIESGPVNQQRISITHAQIPQGSGINLVQRTRQQKIRRSILPTPPNNNKTPNCCKCEYKFIKEHLDNSLAKNTVYKICKKKGHYAKECRTEIPPRRSETQKQSIKRNKPNQNYNRTQQQNTWQQQVNARRVRNQTQKTKQFMKKKKMKQKPSTRKAHVILEKWWGLDFSNLHTFTQPNHSRQSKFK